jgi:glycyl-tRNA synthetase beta chain
MKPANADLLFELGTEELPAGPLLSMGEALRTSILEGLADHGLLCATNQIFVTPRRLAVLVRAVSLEAPDKTVEALGPPVAAARDKAGDWTAAALGFAKKQGVEVTELEVINTSKGDRLGLRRIEAGAQAASVLPQILANAVTAIPVTKRMRWGRERHEFLRPVQWVVALLGKEVIDVVVMGISSDRHTLGHRFHHPDSIDLKSPEQYEGALLAAYVLADFGQRRERIRNQVMAIAKNLNANAVIDEALLNEVTGLVEWPVALQGSFDPAFLEVPAGAVISSMKEHQKYFHLVSDQGHLLPLFITIANIESNNPASVIAGNERVIRPRLSDAAFFFETDKATPLADRGSRLEGIVFQQKLGSVADKTRRITALSGWVAGALGADVSVAQRAATLAKCDLVSDLVLEFPDLQGIAGAHYSRHDGELEAVSASIEEHYWPRFSGDQLPKSPEAAAVAIADRLDTLVGIFGIGQAPTGSKDPFALRRGALAVIRLLVNLDMQLDLLDLTKRAASEYPENTLDQDTAQAVTEYTLERFRSWYEDQDIPVEVLRAVLATGITAPAQVDRRVTALNAFAGTEAAVALAAANKRVANILNKSDQTLSDAPNPELFHQSEERQLYQSLQTLKPVVADNILKDDYAAALSNLASLQGPVDAFFEGVMVNADDPATRTNRHELLAALRSAFTGIADFALLGGASK